MTPKSKNQMSFRIVDGEERVNTMLRSMRAFLYEAPGNYVTLSLVGPQRTEKQLKRSRRVVSPFRWMQLMLLTAAQPGKVRFRLRFWKAGGRSAGGVVFSVEYEGVPEARSPPRPAAEEPETLRRLLQQESQTARAEREQLQAELTRQREELMALVEQLRTLEGGHQELEQAFIQLCGSISG